MKSLTKLLLGGTSLVMASAAVPVPAAAQDVTGAPISSSAEPGDEESEIVVTGTRFSGRTVAESPTPIDVIQRETLAAQGRTDVLSALRLQVPSLTTTSPTGSNFTDFSTPILLRGLSSGQVLVLVNGKRRHTVGEINQANSLGRGDVTYDLNSIPLAAVGRVEILRDGAAAQYGSDAIAGVVNLVLDETSGVTARATGGITEEGDGERADLNLGYGIPLGEGGIVRISAQYRKQKATNRAAPDTRQQYLGSNGTASPSGNFGSGIGLTPSAGTLDPREAMIDRDLFAIGQSPYELGSGLVNLRVPLSADIELRGFGGYSRLDGDSLGFFRRAGQDETVRVLYPNGYLPISKIRFDDFTASAGLSGGDVASLAWDVSTVFGGVKVRSRATNTNNPSFGTASPTSFDRGSTNNRQWTSNLDLRREIAFAGDDAPLKLAAGLEYRKDFYDITAGSPSSYDLGGATIIGGTNNGRPAPGAQPISGFAPRDEVDVSRNSKAVYAEAEKEFFDQLTLSGAVRYEDYSDFGDTANYKLTARWAPTDWLAIRANYGTGFRAPALAQSWFGTGTNQIVNGQQTTVRIFNVNDPVAALVGAAPLRPEKSKSLSGGAVFTLPGFTATIDAYRIAIDDRIVISSQFQDARITALLASQGFTGIGAVTFLTNAVDSTTKGIDVTLQYRRSLGDLGRITANFAGNFTKTRLDRIAGTPAALTALGITTPLFDRTQQVRFTDSQPENKIVGNLDWERGRVRIGLTVVRYGEVSAVALTGRTPAQVAALTQGYDVTVVPVSATSANSDLIQNFGARTIASLEAGVRLTSALRLTAGVDNLFDTYPEENIRSSAATVAAGTNGADSGGPVRYNPISPFGFNGRSYLISLGYQF